MKHLLVLGLTTAAVTAALAGCSSADESTPASSSSTAAGPGTGSETPSGTAAAPAAQPGTGRVTLNNADLSPATNVSCQTDGGVVTIDLESTPKTTVVVTDEDTPAVRSVTIGELGSGGPSMVYVDGVSGKAQATRTDKNFTVTGTGTGAAPDAPDKPTEMPFEIAVTCP